MREVLFVNKNILILCNTKKLLLKKTLQALSKYKSFFLINRVRGLYSHPKVLLSLLVKGSISVEAAIVLPVFLFCFLELLSLLNYLAVYNGMLYSIHNIGKSISIYGCAYEELSTSEESIHIGKEIIASSLFSEVFLKSELKRTLQNQFYGNTIDKISLLGSRVDGDKQMLFLNINYTLSPDISVTGKDFKMSTCYVVRLWSGHDANTKEKSEDEYVYITDNAEVYHVYKDCSHLKLSIEPINYKDILTAHNIYGERYVECILCDEKENSINKYYITKQGNRYHKNILCSGLKRTIYRISIGDVSDLSMCMRCKKRNEEMI